jgi:hypothetical protein
MAIKRKTYEVEKLRAYVNKALANDHWTAEQKQAMAFLLESVLMDTGNYRGFNYLKWVDEGGYEAWLADGQPDFPEKDKYLGDKMRRRYY